MRSGGLILVSGGLLGLGGVIVGALLDHSVANLVLQIHAADTALRYQQLNAIIITMLGLILCFSSLSSPDRKRLAITAILLTSGTLIFCGSLYVLAFTGVAYAAYGTPIGGITLMAGWAALIWAALQHRSNN